MSQLSSIADLRAQAAPALAEEAPQGAAPGGFGAMFDLSNLNGDNGFRLDGEHTYDWAGRSVASAGDVNGDGFDDLIIGASAAGDEISGTAKGGAYVVFGHAGAFDAAIDLGSLDGSDGFFIQGSEYGEMAGYRVGGAGDVNGDGVADMIVGAVNTNYGPGAAYVIYGHQGDFASELDLDHFKKSDGFKLTGAHLHDTAGSWVTSAGDINADGVDDILVGAEGASTTYVVFGKAGGLGNVDLGNLKPSAGFEIVGNGGRIGASVSAAGDVNGDGIADILIGAGSGYVVFGKSAGFGSVVNVSELDGSDGFVVQTESGISSVSTAGDVNGDGFDDIILGDINASGDEAYSGKAYVIFGHAGGFDATFDLSSLDGRNGFSIAGEQANAALGYPVASAGDVNGDGFDDLFVSAVQGSGPSYSYDVAYVIYGKASGFHADFDLSKLNGSNGFEIGTYRTTHAGALSAGDLNGDGLSDLVIGADADASSGQNAGSTFVIFGQAPTTAVKLVGTEASQTLVGGELKDVLSGMAGDDMLWGHGGKDKLTGGTGNDTLIGGAGKDVLVGSAGADVFQYRDVGDSTLKAHDLIKAIGATDVIDLHLLDAGAGTAGDQAFHLVSSFSHHAGELTVSFDGKQTLVQGDVNGDGTADLVIAISGDHHDFTSFVL